MEERLHEIQDGILERLHAGEPIDRARILSENPEHAPALERFFGVLDEIEGRFEETPPEGLMPVRLGEFVVLREIGRGGMGVVYEAEQISLKRRVALKVLPVSMTANPKVVQRFRREAQAAGSLRHPHIVGVHSVGEARGQPFFAMELVEGRSLEQILDARRRGDHAGLPPPGAPWRRWVAATLAKVADALAYAHTRGILHRDVKPANVLIETDGRPRLTDFGLAMDLGEPGLTAAGETFGTPLYMSPEQAIRREQPLDARTDVYSLGVTLYETLTLGSPYEGDSAGEIFAALRNGKIVAPHAVDPEMPRSLEAVLLKAMAHDPAERYAGAAAFAVDLRATLSPGVPRRPEPPRPEASRADAARVAAPSIPPPAPTRPPRRALVVALIAVCAVVAGGVVWRLLERADTPSPPTADPVARQPARPEPVRSPPSPPPSVPTGPEPTPTPPPERAASAPPTTAAPPVAPPPTAPVESTPPPTPPVEAPQPEPSPTPSAPTIAPPAPPTSPAPAAPAPSPAPRVLPPPTLSQTQRDEAERLGVPAWFDNAIGMRFVLIPSGTFSMGAPSSEPAFHPDQTRHTVILTRPYYLQATEVTWGHWRRWRPGASTGPIEGLKADADDQPLTRIAPPDLEAFVTWLTVQDGGRTYALPTEARWEHACRAGTTTMRYWGDELKDGAGYENLADQSVAARHPTWILAPFDDGFEVTAPVASFRPNPWGLYDMLGNVGEWTSDDFRPLGPEPARDPRVRAPGEERRVSKGGAWHNDWRSVRAAHRGAVRWQDWQDMGVRLVTEVPRARAGLPEPRLSKEQLAEAKRLGVPAWFDNPVGMRFVLVPSGRFVMGQPESERGAQPEAKQHRVTLTKAYYLQATEVTWGHWRRWDPSASTGPVGTLKADHDDHPMIRMYPDQIEGFLKWLSSRDGGRAYSLPTEAQWEYACRAGTTTARWWGDDVRDGLRYANLADLTAKRAMPEWEVTPVDDGFEIMTAVASFEPNPWGLFDMLGNVSEWTADDHKPYATAPATDPLVRVRGSTTRVARGGAWHNDPTSVRCGHRFGVIWDAWQDMGIRLVAEVRGKSPR